MLIYHPDTSNKDKRNRFGISVCFQLLLLISTCVAKDMPVIKVFNFEDNIKEGDIVSVMCLTIAGAQPITFAWEKNGEELQTSNNLINIENSPVVSVLILNGVSTSSDGNYTCSAKNNFGSSHHTASLTVKAASKWVQKPSDVTTVVGDSINVFCSAIGSPKPKILWKKYSGSSYERVNFTFNQNGDFRIPSVTYNDAGTYQCTADNGIPPAIQTNFTITIRGRT
ncbi:leucine-rich repeats and immunoglobulin-like domains protein 3 [Uloborus diversus]|uniref:leucine-rich repeats and immunoglobulin-like domains protein 3 n=1 Tax=Uloborus diversus TaxID=327109 RepID=UPI00240A395A|nr:leucine-rich repeats and immunoglobulin-like domains protein 3 [Uloborus diversus]